MNTTESQSELFIRISKRLNIFERERKRGIAKIALFYVLLLVSLLGLTAFGMRYFQDPKHFLIALVALGIGALFFRPAKMEEFRGKARDLVIANILRQLESPFTPGKSDLPLQEVIKSDLFRDISFSDTHTEDFFSGRIADRLVGFCEMELLGLRYRLRYNKWQMVTVFRGILLVIGDQKQRPLSESRVKDLAAKISKHYRVEVVGDYLAIVFSVKHGILEVPVWNSYNSKAMFQRIYGELSLLNRVLCEACTESDAKIWLPGDKR